MGWTDDDKALFHAALISACEVSVVVESSSMLPALSPGDVVTLLPAGIPRLGDLVALFIDDATDEDQCKMVEKSATSDVKIAWPLLVHRVIGVRSDGNILTKGDNRPRPDGWTNVANVAALVRS